MSAEDDARRIGGKFDRLKRLVAERIAVQNLRSGEELVRIARVLVSVKSGESKAEIKGTAMPDGSYLADFGSISKPIEGGRKDPIADPSRKLIGTTSARPFVNPALSVTRKKWLARNRAAINRAVKDSFGG